MSGLATRRALYGKLAGDATLNGLLGTPAPGYSKAIYYQQAPADAGYPYLILQKQAATPTYTFKAGPPAALNEEVWLIKSVDRDGSSSSISSSDAVDGIAARLDALLTDGAISIAGARQLYLRRESDVDYSELTDGQRYVHAGSLFRLVYE